ncbi:hypothetical protein [Actinoalloteichus sp. AHMU CJ021]|uniref:hypothetical protein n=1 Tax=Actinoalloteichus sp. AHMU CJ021 TaxID=2072503 RepID=UPI00307B8F2E
MRRPPPPDPLGARRGPAFPVAQLTVTRVLLGGLGWLDSSVRVEFTQPDAMALIFVRIAFGGLVFLTLRKLLERRAARQEEVRTAA